MLSASFFPLALFGGETDGQLCLFFYGCVFVRVCARVFVCLRFYLTCVCVFMFLCIFVHVCLYVCVHPPSIAQMDVYMEWASPSNDYINISLDEVQLIHQLCRDHLHDIVGVPLPPPIIIPLLLLCSNAMKCRPPSRRTRCARW